MKIILLMSITLCSFVSEGQITFKDSAILAPFKIGSISMDEQTFKDYVADCYLRPDTVTDKSLYDFMCNNCIVSDDVYKYAKEEASKWHNNLVKNNLGHTKKKDVWYWLMPRKPTEEDLIKWYNSKELKK